MEFRVYKQMIQCHAKFGKISCSTHISCKTIHSEVWQIFVTRPLKVSLSVFIVDCLLVVKSRKAIVFNVWHFKIMECFLRNDRALWCHWSDCDYNLSHECRIHFKHLHPGNRRECCSVEEADDFLSVCDRHWNIRK